MIAANQVGDRLAFDCDDNALTVYWPGGKRELARASKHEVAAGLVSVIAERFASGERVAATDAGARGSGSAAAR
jgi:phosphopantothenoylcysteine synthetase/decarboxylase